MDILHVSAECYPVAKAGGLGDVAGALPKYQQKAGHNAMLVMPMYRTKFLYEHEWEVKFKGRTNMGDYWFDYTIIKEKHNTLGFTLYLMDIYALLDREKVYGYDDDSQRFTAFQIAVAHWLNYSGTKPDVVHCHDHHSGFIPFMFKYCYGFQSLKNVPTVFTIHNAQYQGALNWDRSIWIPAYDSWKTGLLDWNGNINPLASAVKNAWKVTTVSPNYMRELAHNSNGLEKLFEYENGKCSGILNCIDTEVWNPATDHFITDNYSIDNVAAGKQANKEALCKEFGLDPKMPLFAFIGRLVREKAADILPDAILSSIYSLKGACSFFILGSGEMNIEQQLYRLHGGFPGIYTAIIGYNEALSHRLYASADFLLMPSRIEPCGLNQMYAMRYGTIPMVRRTGGLLDTVKDVGEGDGWGLCFDNASVGDIMHATDRAAGLYKNKEHLSIIRTRMMNIDHSWENTVEQYLALYRSVK
jgi:starch synthase